MVGGVERRAFACLGYKCSSHSVARRRAEQAACAQHMNESKATAVPSPQLLCTPILSPTYPHLHPSPTMAPGVLRIRTACCSIIIPVRIALCVPLLVATLDAYSSPHPAAPTSSPHSPASPLLNNTTPPNAAPDAPDGIFPSAQLLPIAAAETGEFSVISFPQGESRARALALTFCALAALLGLLSIISTWCSSDEHDPDSAVESEPQSDGTPMSVQAKEFAGRASSSPDRYVAEAGRGVWGLFLGAATRLLLAALGTTAFIEVILERQRADPARSHNPGAFAAMMGLGWTLV